MRMHNPVRHLQDLVLLKSVDQANAHSGQLSCQQVEGKKRGTRGTSLPADHSERHGRICDGMARASSSDAGKAEEESL